ncbi:hypothetical protein FKW77_009232 [Venturia effusa]|uniref:Cell wall protein n=1 Tax=Venturia effusa TaxID=50376 RepID=A0A517LG84_9PEZI|nr:hypothetical protein FKW77_009232 [Venturia effusa]
MRFSTVAFRLIMALTSIQAAPTAQMTPSNHWLAESSPAARQNQAANQSSQAGTQSSQAGQGCAADIDRLASGIQQNIFIQGDELSTAQRIVDLLQQIDNKTVTLTPTVFNMGQALKAQLLTFVDAGVAVRTMNQGITPSGSVVTAGLAKVANSQQMELGLTSSLTGDVSVDIATGQTLVKAFAMGMQQNMQNLLDATQGCMPSDVIAQKGLQTAVRAGLKAALPSSN